MEPGYFDIRDYGAVSGGEVLCTGAFEQAIMAAAVRGGTVRVAGGNLPDRRYFPQEQYEAVY